MREDKKTLKDAKDYIDELFKKNENWDNSLFFDYDIEALTKDSEIATVLLQEKTAKKKVAEKEKKVSSKRNISDNGELLKFLNELIFKIKEL